MTHNNSIKRPSASISVIMPCFNAGATLGVAINSALEQVDVKVEIVVVDDGSTDNSLAVARAFEPALRVITGPNRGASAARNRGTAETAAEWIVFLDSDDFLVRGTLNARLRTAQSTEVDVIL
ncbi:MAG TPA: glycosyltransferase family 2 protein, partial [Pirellulales bacterium]|nr:glycosyltransferase family 2 protein [Pirellulales bacterium]